MEHRHLELDEQGRLTLRVRVGWLAFAAALVLHLVVGLVASLLPEPPKKQERLQFTLARPSAPRPPAPAPPAPSAPQASRPEARPKPRPAPRRKPVPSPVAPVLPPSADPPDDRARLPVAETSPEPTPEPPTWEEQLRDQLAATTPKWSKSPGGALAPSFAALSQVAGSDPRLHDEKTEQRLMQSFGPFFRRGIEALRGHWHPDRVLNGQDFLRKCGTQTRTTYAVAVLDREGNVVDVDLRRSSDCPGLDEEAIAAFKRVAQFPHPPAGLFVAPDGTPVETARYPVRFIVTFDGGLQIDWR